MKKKIILISSFILVFLVCMALLIFNLRESDNMDNIGKIGFARNFSGLKKIDKKTSDVIIYYGSEKGTMEEKSVILPKENEKIEKVIFDKVKDDTEILENVEVISVETINGICNLNVTKEFVSSLQGSIGEELTIYSIVNSLTELNHIEEVQFFIEGKKGFETGHNTYYETLIRNEGLLK